MDILNSILGDSPAPASDAVRLTRIERKLDLILAYLGIEDSPTQAQNDLSAAVKDLLRRGKKLDAIKLYREETGVGLKDAKDAVEALE